MLTDLAATQAQCTKQSRCASVTASESLSALEMQTPLLQPRPHKMTSGVQLECLQECQDLSEASLPAGAIQKVGNPKLIGNLGDRKAMNSQVSANIVGVMEMDVGGRAAALSLLHTPKTPVVGERQQLRRVSAR